MNTHPNNPPEDLGYESVSGALDHIDALRHVVEAAIKWRLCKYTGRAQTVEETQHRHDAVRSAESHLKECLDELLVILARDNLLWQLGLLDNMTPNTPMNAPGTTKTGDTTP